MTTGGSIAGDGIVARIEQLLAIARRLGGPHVDDTVSSIEERLHGPLRVAIAGRVKAGKSTLLNALVGERLAPTDAGECTRIVTWYLNGVGYGVDAVLRSGERQSLRFDRTDRSLDVDLGELDAEEIDHIEVTWPSVRLTEMTLIDTPGLQSLDEDRSLRTQTLFGIGVESPSDVDAVLYLMNHLHPSDREFLDAFLDRSLARPSPVNAIAVLSRADEIGAGRLDALESAAAIAERYAADDRIRRLCSTVVPVAGLIAETAFTLRENEFADLQQLGTLDRDQLELLLVSVHQFCAPGVGPLTVGARRDLLDRLGLFGVRFGLAEIAADRASTAHEMARALRTASGIEQLVRLVDEQLAPLSGPLRARSALVALRALVAEVARQDQSAAEELAAAIERTEAGAHDLAELRLLHLVSTGQVELSGDERAEVVRLVRSADRTARLGLPRDADVDAQERSALAGLDAWRTRGEHPLTPRPAVEACRIITESYERIYAELHPPPAGD